MKDAKKARANLLNRYGRIVDAAQKDFNVLLAEHALLQKDRQNLARARTERTEEKKAWNKSAETWRKNKVSTLQTAQSKHKPLYTSLIQILLTLAGEDLREFEQQIKTIAEKYDDPYEKLFRRTLIDLLTK